MGIDQAGFGQQVRARREELGLTQAQVREAGGPSDTTLTKIESGEGPAPSRATLRKLEQALHWAEGSALTTLGGGEPVPDLQAERLRKLGMTYEEAYAEKVVLPERADAGGRSRTEDRTTGRKPDDIFQDWAQLQSRSLMLMLEYGRVRDLDPPTAHEELQEVLVMAQQLKDGRPWTPPWAPNEYGDDAEPWRESWWTARRPDLAQYRGADGFRRALGMEPKDDAQVQEQGTEESGTLDSSTSSTTRNTGAPIGADEIPAMTRQVRRASLPEQIQWVRENGLQQRDHKELVTQAQQHLASSEGGGLDASTAIDPEVPDDAYVQFLAWWRMRWQGGPAEPRPLDEATTRLALRRWRRELSEIVEFGRIRTNPDTPGAVEAALEGALAIMDPAAGSGKFLDVVMAQGLNAENQAQTFDIAYSSSDFPDTQADYALARRTAGRSSAHERVLFP